jgi:hypothetical protein
LPKYGPSIVLEVEESSSATASRRTLGDRCEYRIVMRMSEVVSAVGRAAGGLARVLETQQSERTRRSPGRSD